MPFENGQWTPPSEPNAAVPLESTTQGIEMLESQVFYFGEHVSTLSYLQLAGMAAEGWRIANSKMARGFDDLEREVDRFMNVKRTIYEEFNQRHSSPRPPRKSWGFWRRIAWVLTGD